MREKPSRVDLACDALRRAIIEQALPPGSKLPEDELCAHFKMSRTLVRTKLARQHAEGLVDAPPRRAATTAKPTNLEAKEIFGVRRALEHSAECAVNEHREILNPLRKKDVQAACALMDHHLGAVEERALLNGDRTSPPDLAEVLGRYADRREPPPSTRSIRRKTS